MASWIASLPVKVNDVKARNNLSRNTSDIFHPHGPLQWNVTKYWQICFYFNIKVDYVWKDCCFRCAEKSGAITSLFNNQIALANWLWEGFKFGSKVWVWSMGSIEVAWYASVHMGRPLKVSRSLQSLAFNLRGVSTILRRNHSVASFWHLPSRHLLTRHLPTDI